MLIDNFRVVSSMRRFIVVGSRFDYFVLIVFVKDSYSRGKAGAVFAVFSVSVLRPKARLTCAPAMPQTGCFFYNTLNHNN